jgi:surface antigen
MPDRSAFVKMAGAFVLAGVMASAYGSNLRFLEDSAVSKMTDADTEVLRSAMRKALDDTPDGQSRRWENPATGARGVLTPLDTFDLDGVTCRKLELSNEIGGVSGRSVFDFCRQADGTWKIPAKGSTAAPTSQ